MKDFSNNLENMKFKIVFFDNNQERIDSYAPITTGNNPNITLDFKCGDVRDIIRESNAHILVSPANCYGWMDGGIDDIYRKIFPEIESRVKSAIRRYDMKTGRDDYVLPIGSSILVPTGPGPMGKDLSVRVLACVPTMVTPENITTKPRNIYWAMRGLLKMLDQMARKYAMEEKQPTTIIVACPCFGTGVGGMSATESAKQIQSAFFDHSVKEPSICEAKCEVKVLTQIDSLAYVLSNHANVVLASNEN